MKCLPGLSLKVEVPVWPGATSPMPPPSANQSGMGPPWSEPLRKVMSSAAVWVPLPTLRTWSEWGPWAELVNERSTTPALTLVGTSSLNLSPSAVTVTLRAVADDLSSLPQADSTVPATRIANRHLADRRTEPPQLAVWLRHGNGGGLPRQRL